MSESVTQAASESHVLEVAYKAISDEFERLIMLINSGETGPFEKYADRIKSSFSQPGHQLQLQIKQKLRAIQQDIEDKRFENAWCNYVQIKSELIPTFSSELLAIIGGIYLMKTYSDRILLIDDSHGSSPDWTEKLVNYSFSDWAEKLVQDLSGRSSWVWSSVLIVGEEWFSHSSADVIRLRFPACDIWHMPLAAHEYGYLVAHRMPGEKFHELCQKVQDNVNPRNHPIGSPPEDRACYLEEVQEHWRQYHDLGNEVRRPIDREEYLKVYKKEFDLLADRQKAHLCRLFADAFATFFMGPAYVHALLCLNFIPNESLYASSAQMPAFAQRFVFAMETLTWMNNTPLFEVQSNQHLFSQEVDETVGIPSLWRNALQSAGQENHYTKMKDAFQPWFKQITEALAQSYYDENAIGKTYQYWKVAQRLKNEIDNNPKVTAAEKKCIIVPALNAAWSVRWQHPKTSLKTIQHIVLRLLDPDDEETILPQAQTKSPDPSRYSSGQPIPDQKQEKIDIILKCLSGAGRFDLRNKFKSLADTGNFQFDADIAETIGANDKAVAAYSSIVSQNQ